MPIKYSPKYRQMFEPILKELEIFSNKTYVAKRSGLRWHTLRSWGHDSMPSLVQLGKLVKAYPFMKERLLEAISKGWDTLPEPPMPPPPYKRRPARRRQRHNLPFLDEENTEGGES